MYRVAPSTGATPRAAPPPQQTAVAFSVHVSRLGEAAAEASSSLADHYPRTTSSVRRGRQWPMAGMLIGLGGSGRRASGRTVIGHPRLGFHCSPVLPKPSACWRPACLPCARTLAGRSPDVARPCRPVRFIEAKRGGQSIGIPAVRLISRPLKMIEAIRAQRHRPPIAYTVVTAQFRPAARAATPDARAPAR
jgi:hypothetical protein